MSKKINNKSNFSTISLFSEKQKYLFNDSEMAIDYDLTVTLWHYDDVTFKIRFKNEDRLKRFMNSLYYQGFTLIIDGLILELKSNTDINKDIPIIQLSGGTTSKELMYPQDLRELYNIFSKQYKMQVKKELKSIKLDGPIRYDEESETYCYEV